ncbi:MAG: tRNA glutamyl-Q(34) synthetase GluQRS [Propionivibrio sp.]
MQRPPQAPASVRYRGRFAPSPTGPLHFGSLVAALGSYLDARAQGGEWLLRIEDIDQPRTVAGAADDIQRTLAAFGFEWDGEVLVQSRRLDRYHAALVRLQLDGDVYPCACSRSEIAAVADRHSVDGGLLYPGICRHGLAAGKAARAWRLRVPDREMSFVDRIQGAMRQNLERDVGDFVLLRADGQYAYQLAVVVDDAEQGVTDVLRGADLLDSTLRQIYLQQRLGLPTPVYAHLPVVVNAAGEKLSKQTRAAAVEAGKGSAVLAEAMALLGQPVPAELRGAPLPEFWAWAIAAWSIARVPSVRGIFPGRAA